VGPPEPAVLAELPENRLVLELRLHLPDLARREEQQGVLPEEAEEPGVRLEPVLHALHQVGPFLEPLGQGVGEVLQLVGAFPGPASIRTMR